MHKNPAASPALTIKATALFLLLSLILCTNSALAVAISLPYQKTWHVESGQSVKATIGVQNFTDPTVYEVCLEVRYGDPLIFFVPECVSLEPYTSIGMDVTIEAPIGTASGEYKPTVCAFFYPPLSGGIGVAPGVCDWIKVVVTAPLTVCVPLDIKPGSCPNPLNVKSKGVLSVAILGSEDLNVEEIDPASIRLEGVAPIRSNYEDVSTPFEGEPCDCHVLGADGYLDLTLKFHTQQIIEAIGDVSHGEQIILTITGSLTDGTSFEGEDCVTIIKKGRK